MPFFLFFFFLTLTAASQSATAQQLPIPFGDGRIRYEGRIMMTDSAAVMSWTASSATIRFEGRDMQAELRDQKGENYFTVVVDGKVTGTIKLDTGRKIYSLVQGLADGTHVLRIFKRTEWTMGKTWLYGFRAGAHVLQPLAGKKRKLEFYGNSITCGYAVEDTTGRDRGTAPFENAYDAYAAITARHFDAELSCIAKSGIGVTISWFPLIMPEMYDRLDPDDEHSKWDFSRYKPDIVVVNLFQNDSWLVNMPDHDQFRARFGTTAPTPAFLVEAYRKFIETLRGRHPDAYIICMLGNMDATKAGAPWPGYIEQAVGMLHDKKMLTFTVPFKGTPGHPSRAEQASMADLLCKFIQQHVRW